MTGKHLKPLYVEYKGKDSKIEIVEIRKITSRGYCYSQSWEESYYEFYLQPTKGWRKMRGIKTRTVRRNYMLPAHVRMKAKPVFSDPWFYDVTPGFYPHQQEIDRIIRVDSNPVTIEIEAFADVDISIMNPALGAMMLAKQLIRRAAYDNFLAAYGKPGFINVDHLNMVDESHQLSDPITIEGTFTEIKEEEK